MQTDRSSRHNNCNDVFWRDVSHSLTRLVSGRINGSLANGASGDTDPPGLSR